MSGLPGVWQTVDVLYSRRADTGAVLAQTGSASAQRVDDPDAVLWQSLGVVARPKAPGTDGRGCQAIVLRSSGRDYCIAYRDVRALSLAGALGEGDTCVYATDGQARALFKADGSITLITTADNTATGQTVLFSVGTTGIKAVTPWGVATIDENGIQLAAAGGASFLKLDADGFTVSGAAASLACGAVNLGAAATAATAVAVGPASSSGATAVCSTSVFASL